MAKRSSYVVEVKDNNFFFKSDSHKAMFKNWLEEWNGQKVRVELSKVTSQRTPIQSKALHLYFDHIAEELNNAGFTVQLVLKEKVDLEWDATKVKELLWRPAQKAITGKKSTIDLRKTGEIDYIYDHLTRHLGEKFGIFVPFPTQNHEE